MLDTLMSYDSNRVFTYFKYLSKVQQLSILLYQPEFCKFLGSGLETEDDVNYLLEVYSACYVKVVNIADASLVISNEALEFLLVELKRGELTTSEYSLLTAGFVSLYDGMSKKATTLCMEWAEISNVELAEALKKSMLKDSLLEQLSDYAMQTLLRELDNRDLTYFLLTTTAATKLKVYKNVSSRMGAMLREDEQLARKSGISNEALMSSRINVFITFNRMHEAGVF